MRRREFITALGGAAAWPIAARGQQPDRVRRVATLALGEADQRRQSILWDELAKLGWVEGRNLRRDVRYDANNANRLRDYAAEIVSLGPDVIVAQGQGAVRAVQQRHRPSRSCLSGVVTWSRLVS
jgi:putative ABC transport system substrate-binding protein